ncbi:hypothetical protein ABLN87_16810 [Ruegeria sp. SCPT10]|uniref:hypothetical protein n=1 Tax=Ruegeria sp. SCP10 TaxID=3141377 RepID=UPI00333DDD7E
MTKQSLVNSSSLQSDKLYDLQVFATYLRLNVRPPSPSYVSSVTTVIDLNPKQQGNAQ